MAEDKEKNKKEEKPAAQEGGNESKTAEKKSSGLFMWLIMLAIVIAGSTGGFALSQLVGGAPADVQAAGGEKPEEASSDPEAIKNNTLEALNAAEGTKPWSYDKLDAVVANLDEPGVSRYVRVQVILEMSAEMDSTLGTTFLDEKKVQLQDWMTTYFAGLNLEDVRGSRNLNRIKKEILDQFNQILFKDEKPYIERVLFKEFAVQ